MELLYPQSGFVEIDPEKLWTSALSVIKKAIEGEMAILLKEKNYLAG